MESAATATATVFGNLIQATGATGWGGDVVAVCNDVLDAAQAWADGAMPLAAFARIGTLKPPAWSHKNTDTGSFTTCRGNDAAGYSRWKALVYALKTHDERLGVLQQAFAALDTVWGFDAVPLSRSQPEAA